MKIEFLKKDNDTITLIIKDTEPVTINTLRRTIIDNVPTLAIEDVALQKNSSALYDEIIAHRLGLVVLKTDLKSYNLPTECPGKKKDEEVCTKENCPHHTVLFKLKAKADKDTKMVYAEELVSKDKKIKPVHPKTPIVKLLKIGKMAQELELEARAIMGEGKDHMKFSPGIVYYQGFPEIKIGAVKEPEAISAACPRKVYEVKNKKLAVKDIHSCILCKSCVDASEGAIEVKGSDKDFIFNIETWGQLTHKEILLKAIEVMDSKIDNFEKLLKKV